MYQRNGGEFEMNSKKDFNKCCGNCARLETRIGEDGLPRTYCSLDGKERFKNQMEGCLGWEKGEL